MPFKSTKQKTYLAINKPKVYKKFKKEETMIKRKNSGKVKIEVKNKDGTINKKETARLKENARLLELERKKDMSGKPRKKRITEIPRDAIIQGTRKIMSIMPGAVGREGEKQLMLNRMAKEVDRQKMTNKNMGGKVYKVDNSGQQLVAKQYGGKIHG